MGGEEHEAGGGTAAPLAVVIGASGGLGAALVRGLRREPRWPRVLALSRRPPDKAWDAAAEAPADAPRDVTPDRPTAGLVQGRIDLTDPDSIAAAARQAAALGEVRLVIVATGLLHGPGVAPEKHWGAIDPQAMATLFAVNCTGPALVARHFLHHGGDAQTLLAHQLAAIGQNLAGDDLEQRRLAFAVAADDANALAPVEAERRLVEQVRTTKGHRNITQGKQSHGLRRSAAKERRAF